MKKWLFLILLLPTLVFGQTGAGYTPSGEGKINYKSYKTHYGNGNPSTFNGGYSGGAGSTAEFDRMVDTNQPGTTLTHVGEATPWSSGGLNGGHPPRWGNSYFAIVYSGWFKPNKSGTYNFKTYADDSSETRYREVGTTTWQTITFQWGCCSNRYGTATLDKTKWYEFEFRYQEYGGGDYYYFGYSIPANSSSPNYNWISSNHQFGTWTNVSPTTEETHELDLTYELDDDLDATKFSTTIHYECTDNSGGICATVNTLGSDGTISFDETAINEDLVNDGTLKATTESGSVEWVVLYPYDSTNDRHRILIDGREFTATNPDTDPNDLTSLQLLDLYDGPITVHSVSEGSGGWQQYYIPGNLTTAISNSSYGSGVIRNAGSYFGIRAEFTFEENTSFSQHTLNLSVDGTYYDDQYDNVITVQDLVIAFNQLTSGGSGPGNSGGSVFSTGIEYVLGDVNEDGSFNFVDTQLMLQHIYGDTDPFADKTFSDVVKIFNSGYDDWSTTNWSNGIPSSTSDSYTPNSTTLEQSKTYQVAFMGDVNFSHSHEPSNLTTAAQSMSVRYSSAKGSSSEEDSIGMEINKIDGHLQIVLTIPSNNYNIVGTQFKVYYDSDKLEYLEAEYVSPTEIDGYVTVRDRYINIGSLSQDGSVNSNQGITYALHFKMNTDLDSTLGLLGLKFYELVDGDGNKVNLKIK